MSWTKLRLAMMNNSMLNSTCSSVKTTSVTIASIQGLLKKITVKSSTRTQQTELPITNSSLSANKATSSSTWYESESRNSSKSSIKRQKKEGFVLQRHVLKLYGGSSRIRLHASSWATIFKPTTHLLHTVAGKPTSSSTGHRQVFKASSVTETGQSFNSVHWPN